MFGRAVRNCRFTRSSGGGAERSQIGPWLIHDHLATRPGAEAERLERAIRAVPIRWHALPFTTHSELMSPPLFRAGLSYSAELDRRFGVTTRAAKMTDVPGHTLGIVPLLAAA